MSYGGPPLTGSEHDGRYGGGGRHRRRCRASRGYGAPRLATIGVNQSDYQEFESILQGVQTAWSNGDLERNAPLHDARDAVLFLGATRRE